MEPVVRRERGSSIRCVLINSPTIVPLSGLLGRIQCLQTHIFIYLLVFFLSDFSICSTCFYILNVNMLRVESINDCVINLEGVQCVFIANKSYHKSFLFTPL